MGFWPSTAPSVIFLVMAALWSARRVSSAPPPLCPRESAPFLCTLQSRCPISISPNPPLQVDGDFLDRFLESKHDHGYTSILFQASRCPFSQATFPTFEVISSMFPQINHLAVEQSSALPSVFSRYGIRSLPSILLVNQTSRMRYHGPKTLLSLVQFYEKNTGYEPVQYIMLDQPRNHEASESSIMHFTSVTSMKELVAREPYLIFSILFLYLRVLLAALPRVVSRLKAFWVSYAPHLNLEIFGETTQILGRLLPIIDVRRLWMKLRLCKAQSFQERVRSARVWASSLASVSLGESSSARSS
ncbi:5'-adenylylsulfate reductase-like 7 [Punica granatum]|uniref:Uncharacterized protein n=2 Tax=Punica granatum TaxID=22663 RepID=A0A2I0L9J9_PUNGR|nr:5'-adenylylsulfate reductase-like 7 [Punica granatum]PKI77364.1 hypothetical protein CRG98_002309 [Punica granatum]